MIGKRIEVLDSGYVELVPKSVHGSDELIIEAARMSTAKGFQGWGPFRCKECHGEGWTDTQTEDETIFSECMCPLCKGKGHTEGDEKLLRYLWEHKHMSPFEMAGFSVEMQLPICVARELIRHRTFSFNELSGRYSVLPDLYYIPSVERLMAGKQATKNKQGSTEGFTEEDAIALQDQLKDATEAARASYEHLLAQGLSRELARLAIPVNQYTKWRMQGVLRNWLQMLTLRLQENVQWETRQYAKAIAEIVEDLFPQTWALFKKSKYTC